MSDYLTHKPGSLEEVVAKATQQESGYQDKFKKELEKTGRGIGSMTPKEKTAFFTKLDKMHKAKDEEVNEGITEPNGTISQKNKDLLKVNNYITVKGKVYVIDKVSLVSGVYTMKAFDKNGKMHTISSKDVDSIEHWKNSLQVAGYNPKNEEDAYDKDDEKPKTKPKKLAASYEEKDVPKGSHKMPDGTIMKDKDHKKEGLESVVPPKNKEEDEKDLKRKTTMTGSKPTEIDTKPQIKY